MLHLPHTQDGLTALHLAAMHDNKELVELLLEHEASCKAQDEVSQQRTKLQR